MEFAIAPCTWGVYWPSGNQLAWDEYLMRCSVAGYGATELGPFGFGPTDADVLHVSLKRRDMSLVAAAHVHTLVDPGSWSRLERDTHAICALLESQGTSHFILMDESEYYPKNEMGVVTPQQWSVMVDQVSRSARIASNYGVKMGFHPHVGTCVETEDQIERLLGDTDPDLVGLCLDTGHHAYWNADPLSFLRRHRARVTSVHLKNVDAEIRARVHAEGIHCDRAFEIGVMTDLDRGAVDIAGVVLDLKAVGFTGPIVVEQDFAKTNPQTPEQIAASNLQFLNSIAGKRVR